VRAKRLALLLVAALAAGGAGAWLFTAFRGPAEQTRPMIDAGDAEAVARGRPLYATHCAACHGVNLEGEADWRTRNPDGTLRAPPHDETGHTWHHPDQELFDVTKHGGQPYMPEGMKSAMPGFGETLTDHEIIAILAFIKSRWPAEIRDRQQRLNERHAR